MLAWGSDGQYSVYQNEIGWVMPRQPSRSVDPYYSEEMTTGQAKKHLSKNQYSNHLPYDSTLGKADPVEDSSRLRTLH